MERIVGPVAVGTEPDVVLEVDTEVNAKILPDTGLEIVVDELEAEELLKLLDSR